jgi:hypothetical protein
MKVLKKSKVAKIAQEQEPGRSESFNSLVQYAPQIGEVRKVLNN